MGLFDSAEEKKRKIRIKEDEKERKRKEFERIMASNPEINEQPKAVITKKTEESMQVKCPKCGGTQLSANKKGFSLGKALVGGLVFAPIGAVATGMIGKNKILITCLSCGKQFKPGK